MAPEQPQAERIDYKIYGVIQQHECDSWVKLLKKSSSWLNSSNALIQHLNENAIFVFLILPGSAEAQFIEVA